MLKYYDVATVFAEFPDEITLAINITNCPLDCEGCSEPWLKPDIGTELTEQAIDDLINTNPNITVFGLMGGDSDHKDVKRIADYIHKKYPELKVGIYSGREYLDMLLLECLDLYKIGRWIMPNMDHPETWKDHTWGPLVWPVSNQLLFEKIGNMWFNVTYKFRKNPISDWSRYIISSEEEQ